MKKKGIFIILSLLIMAVSVYAQTEADFEVDLTEDGTGVLIKRYIGKLLQVRIPATIQGMPVREIGSGAFSREDGRNTPTTYTLLDGYYEKVLRQGITSIVIPEGVTKIGGNAFSGVYDMTAGTKNRCKDSLTSVTIPSTVTEIGGSAFLYQRLLTTVTLPKSLSKAGNNIFANCTALKTVTIPEGVTVISVEMFSGCTALASITIPKTVTRIGMGAFKNTGLTSIVWPASVPIIEGSQYYGMFEGCTKLAKVTLPEGLYLIGDFAFSGTALTTIDVPSTIFEIGEGAFGSCNALTTVTIPETVKGIYFSSGMRRRGGGDGGFGSCPKLNLATQATLRRVKAGTATLIIPNGVTEIKEGDYNIYEEQLKAVVIPSSVTVIGKEAFKNTGLTSVTIPNSVTVIGEQAFYYCDQLTSVTIPDSVTSLGSGTFYGCSRITSVTIGKGITKIESYVFNSCQSLESVNIPEGVTSIGSGAFYNCQKLTSVTFEGTIPVANVPKENALPYGLLDAFYADDKANGTPGTYKYVNRKWTRQE